MPAVTYIAKRRLAVGTVNGTQVSRDFRATEIEVTPEGDRAVKWPLAGRQPEILRHAGWDSWSITLAPLTGTGLATALEFLESVDDQSFTFDPYGTVAVPGTLPAPFSAVLLDRYRIQRGLRRKAGGANDWFILSFRARPT